MPGFPLARFLTVLTLVLAASLQFAAAQSSGGGRSRIDAILAVSWQPSFCETRSRVPECRDQRAGRADASQFSLHGLWPQPRSNIYCNVSQGDRQNDLDGRWSALPRLDLDPTIRRELDIVMPGTRSQLDRHQWVKHGTCYSASPDSYFAVSLALMRRLNASPVRALFADNIGRELTATRIRRAFDEAFGSGAGERVRVTCRDDRDSGRRLIGELTIALAGPLDGEGSFERALRAAPGSGRGGCPSGIVDPAGLQ